MNLHLEKHTGFVIFHLVSLMECFLCSRKAERNLLDCYYPRKITLTYNFNDKKEDFFITHHKCVIFAHLTVKQMTLKGIHLISYVCVCSVSCSAVSNPCDPIDCSLPGSSFHGILQAKDWSGFPFPSPGDLPDPAIEPESRALKADSLPTKL